MATQPDTIQLQPEVGNSSTSPSSKHKLKAPLSVRTPGRRFWTMLRLYGPLQLWFDKTRQPGDFEMIM